MNYLKNNWTALRAHYNAHRKALERAKPGEWVLDPYAWDEGKGWVHMTPIESAFWSDARKANLVLYPQYPACGYFLDFANPAAKVAIECDGAAFHKDKSVDRERDLVLMLDGWTVYRLTGKECKEDFNEETREISTPAKLCKLLALRHGIKAQ